MSTGQKIATTLGLSLTALLRLTGNHQCPQPTTTDGQGNITWTGSAATAITTLRRAISKRDSRTGPYYHKGGLLGEKIVAMTDMRIEVK
jgi:hypothetical protein